MCVCVCVCVDTWALYVHKSRGGGDFFYTQNHLDHDSTLKIKKRKVEIGYKKEVGQVGRGGEFVHYQACVVHVSAPGGGCVTFTWAV